MQSSISWNIDRFLKLAPLDLNVLRRACPRGGVFFKFSNIILSFRAVGITFNSIKLSQKNAGPITPTSYSKINEFFVLRDLSMLAGKTHILESQEYVHCFVF